MKDPIDKKNNPLPGIVDPYTVKKLRDNVVPTIPNAEANPPVLEPEGPLTDPLSDAQDWA